jgi:carbonic anhydrase
MKNCAKFSFTFILLLCCGFNSFAVQPAKSASELGYVRQELQRIIDVNLQYKRNFHDHISEDLLIKQEPDATMVLCSDSRVDTTSFSDKAAGNLFVVRNIGNQVQTAYGSVEYGVNHLHTPFLLIIGHSGCGAIKAGMGDFSKESARLKSELNTLDLNPKDSLNDNIVKNINNQVKMAVEDFKERVEKNQVLVIGMVYDIHNDFKHGYGKLILVNINNEVNPKVLADNQYVKGLKHLSILGLN